MKATGVNLKLLCQIEESDSECVDTILASTDLEDLIEQAKKGDREAAKEVLGLASSYLNSDVFGAMPPELRRYLGRALAEASLGKSADIALNLSRPKGGRPRHSHRTNLRLAHWLYKDMRDNKKSYEDASLDLWEYMGEGTQKYETFYGYTVEDRPGEKGLQAIYDKHLQEIEAIYEEVQKTRASLKR